MRPGLVEDDTVTRSPVDVVARSVINGWLR